MKYNDFLAGNPAFSPSSYESIASATGTGSGSQIVFSSIPATYQHLQLRVIAKDTYTGGSIESTSGVIYFNSDTASNYSIHAMQGNGTSVSASGTATTTGIQPFMATYGPSTNIYGVSIIDIHDYASTTKYKTVRSFMGADANTASASWTVRLTSGLWRSTSAITSITLDVLISGFATGSTFALYGIKG